MLVVKICLILKNYIKNDENENEDNRDIFLQGSCDEMFVKLAMECGWLEELVSFAEEMYDASKTLVLD